MNILKIAGSVVCAVLGTYFIAAGVASVAGGTLLKRAEREGYL